MKKMTDKEWDEFYNMIKASGVHHELTSQYDCPSCYNWMLKSGRTFHGPADEAEHNKLMQEGLKLIMARNYTKPNGNIGRILTAEHKAAISRANKGRVFTDEHKAKLSIANMGKPGPWKGKHMTPEHIAKLVASRTPPTGSKHYRARGVMINGIPYGTIMEAAKDTGIAYANIATRCRSTSKRFEDYKYI